MKVIIGKQWKDKTIHYIKESLTKKSAIWIVPAHYKTAYEQLLLKYSQYQGILFHRVITLDELYEEQLKKQKLFTYKKISRQQMVLIIYQLLKENTVSICSSINMGIIDELINLFKEFSKNEVSNIEVDLPSFSKQKIKECYELYLKFNEYLKNNYLYLDYDLNIIQPHLFENSFYYIDQYDYLSQKDIQLIKMLPNCTTLMTCDLLEDLYTQAVCKIVRRIDQPIEHFKSAPSLIDDYLISNYMNLKAKSYLDKHDFKFMSAINPQLEVRLIAQEIYELIVTKQANYDDFSICCLDGSYLKIIKQVFNEYQLPVYIYQSESLNYHPVMLLVNNLVEYLKHQDVSVLNQMLHSHLIRGFKTSRQVDFIDQAIKTQCNLQSINEIQDELDDLYQKLNQCTHFNQYNQIMYDYLNSLELGHSEQIIQILEKLKRLDDKIKMPLEDYLIIIKDCLNITAKTESKMIQQIPVYNSIHLLKGKKVYILGCCEGAFPKVQKDKGLILNNERIALSKNHLMNPNLYELIEQHYLDTFKLLLSQISITFSFASGTLDGKTMLPSSLFLSLTKWLNAKVVKISQSDIKPITLESARNVLIHQNLDEKNEQLISLRKHYSQFKNQPSNLNPSLYQKLLNKDFISPSELEVYNGCPFKYFIRYGLNIKEWHLKTLQPNDFGTLIHDILDQLTDLFSGQKLIEEYLEQYQINDVEQYYQSNIYQQICYHDNLDDTSKIIYCLIHVISNQKFDSSLMSDSQLYFFLKLQHDLFNTVQILYYLALNSEYKITAHEKGVSKHMGDLKLYGRFDRQENFHQYVKVVDYKSSSKKLDLYLASLGFNIQMLLYLEMITDDTLNYGGVLYFNTKQRVLKSDDYKLNQPILPNDLLKEYKMEGYVLNERSVIEALGREPELVANVKYVKSKDQYSGNILNPQQFKSLIDKVNCRVDEIIDEIYNQGNISIAPSISDNASINMLVDPCTYCKYNTVCLKDIFYNENRDIDYIDKKTMLELLDVENSDK